MIQGIKFRKGEINHKNFTQLPKEEKEKHIKFLLTLDKDILGFNDTTILNNFASRYTKTKNFLTLDDD